MTHLTGRAQGRSSQSGPQKELFARLEASVYGGELRDVSGGDARSILPGTWIETANKHGMSATLDSEFFSATGAWSIGGWLHVDWFGTTHTEAIFAFGDLDAAANGSRVIVTANKDTSPAVTRYFGVSNKGGRYHSQDDSGQSIRDGWAHFMVVVPEGSSTLDIRVYVDGVRVTDVEEIIEAGSEQVTNLLAYELSIGSERLGANNIDAHYKDWGVWNRELTVDDIVAIMQYRSLRSPVSFWSFEEGSGDTVHDMMERHHLTIPNDDMTWNTQGASDTFPTVSWCNEIGWSINSDDANAVIPPSLRDRIRAANGQALDYRGRVPRNASVNLDDEVDFTGGVYAPWQNRYSGTLPTSWTLGDTGSLPEGITAAGDFYTLQDEFSINPRALMAYENNEFNVPNSGFFISIAGQDWFTQYIEARGKEWDFCRNLTGSYFWPGGDRSEGITTAFVESRLTAENVTDSDRFTQFDIEGAPGYPYSPDDIPDTPDDLRDALQAWLNRLDINRAPLGYYAWCIPTGSFTWNGETCDFYGPGHMYAFDNRAHKGRAANQLANYDAYRDAIQYYFDNHEKYCEFLCPTMYMRTGIDADGEAAIAASFFTLRLMFPYKKIIPWVSLYIYSDSVDRWMEESEALFHGKILGSMWRAGFIDGVTYFSFPAIEGDGSGGPGDDIVNTFLDAFYEED